MCPRPFLNGYRCRKRLNPLSTFPGSYQLGKLQSNARRDQRELNGIEAQIAVVQAGGQFWADALAWGQGRKLLTAAETGVLRVASRVPAQTPTDKQSSKAVEILGKLQSNGYTSTLPITS